MQLSSDRILTTHAGSLPRPPSLTALHSARFRGQPVDPAQLEAAVDEAVTAVVARQGAIGIDVGNNGEAPRESFFTYVQHRMTGFGGRSTRPVMADLTRYPGFRDRLVQTSVRREANVNLLAAPKAVGEVAWRGAEATAAECAGLHRAMAAAGQPFREAFMTSPSPGIVAAAMANEHYPSLEDYVAAVGRALAEEYRAIVAAGFVLQIDAPDLAMERHTLFADKPLAEFQAFVRLVVGTINQALAGLDPDRVRLHVCWGNYEGPHDLDVALEAIWPEIARAEVGGHVVALANPRHAHEVGCFGPADLPAGATLVAGVIDTTTNYVEHPEVVAQRIERAVAVVGDPQRVQAGTDCGFETSAGLGAVVEDVAWAKLASLVEGARRASDRLFG